MAITEDFSMTWPDFVGGLMAWFGARVDHDGVWQMPGGMCVSFRCRPWDPSIEPGWFRWALPGLGGVARGRLVDRGAPWIARSPDGRWFWVGRSGMRLMGWVDLLEAVGEHAADLRVRCGWPSGGKMAAVGGAA